jgi:adenylate cyclase
MEIERSRDINGTTFDGPHQARMSRRAIVQDAVRRIQQMVFHAVGRSLPCEAENRLQSILQSVAGHEVATIGGAYSHRDATILLADLRGFAAIMEAFPSHVVLDVLDRCLVTMTGIIVKHYGVIDKFLGDGIMVLFSGDSSDPPDHARRAVLCAVEMQIAMNEFREKLQRENVPEMFLGIGINTGKVIEGLIGCDLYRSYTVIGEDVNLAARIEAFSLRGQVLISESTYGLCQHYAETAEPIQVYMKGRTAYVTIREVKAIPSLGKLVPRQELRKSPRAEVMLPFVYYVLDDKTVIHEPLTGTVYDIGYQGVLAEIGVALSPYTEIKLELALVSLGYRADDIYGRVVNVRETNGRYFIGVEFTSLGRESKKKIQLFVQMLTQNPMWLGGARVIGP